MKDLIDKILTYLPQFFLEYASVLTGPKRFIAEKAKNLDDAFGDACLFLALCIAIGLIVAAPFRPAKVEFYDYLVVAFLSNGVAIIVFASITHLSWWIVRGKAPTKAFFTTYMYFYGVVFDLIAFLALLTWGFVKQTNRPLFNMMLEAARNEGAPQPNYGDAGMTASVLFLVGLAAIAAWCIIAWGAYRELNNLGRLRSFVAFMIALVLCVPGALAVSYVLGALRP